MFNDNQKPGLEKEMAGLNLTKYIGEVTHEIIENNENNDDDDIIFLGVFCPGGGKTEDVRYPRYGRVLFCSSPEVLRVRSKPPGKLDQGAHHEEGGKGGRI